MKNLILTTLFTISIYCANCQSNNEIKLIVRGDDIGSSHAANLACIDSYKNGFMKSVEIMVPCPWFPEAVRMLNENPGLDVGIHLTLTSEWDNVKWRPLTQCPSLVDSSGFFFPMVWPNKNYPGKSISENKWKLDEIEKELRAQIELALKKIPHSSHLSSHMGFTGLSKEISKLTEKLAKEYHLNFELEGYKIDYAGYDGPTKTSEEKIQSFINRLNKLQPGKTYLFVDHPGLDNEEFSAIHHVGYENVGVDRQGVTELFTSKQALEVIKNKGIKVISYKDLIQKQ